ncbi:MAG TPA: YicC/YloC family endoribonuclease [Bacilli bacterium]
MWRSMTGYGQAVRNPHGFQLRVEMKSVNNRYLEISIRMQREWMMLEETLKKIIRQSISRGRVDVFVTIERDAGAERDVQVNMPLAKAYVAAADMLREAFHLSDTVTLQHLLMLPDMLSVKETSSDDMNAVGNEVQQCVRDALEQLIAMREAEGSLLRADLLNRIDAAEKIRAEMLALAPLAVAETSEKLRQRVQELLTDPSLFDEARFATEVAIMADRMNIDEELTRLASHFAQFRRLADSREPVGRKLDFLLQEMNREVNTIGSKANVTALSAKVVEMKAELEKIREQVQNIE